MREIEQYDVFFKGTVLLSVDGSLCHVVRRSPSNEYGSTMESSKTILTLGRLVACVARGQIGV